MQIICNQSQLKYFRFMLGNSTWWNVVYLALLRWSVWPYHMHSINRWRRIDLFSHRKHKCLSSGPEPPLHLMGQKCVLCLLFDHDTALLYHDTWKIIIWCCMVHWCKTCHLNQTTSLLHLIFKCWPLMVSGTTSHIQPDVFMVNSLDTHDFSVCVCNRWRGWHMHICMYKELQKKKYNTSITC